jgi:hypothetical protein
MHSFLARILVEGYGGPGVMAFPYQQKQIEKPESPYTSTAVGGGK